MNFFKDILGSNKNESNVEFYKNENGLHTLGGTFPADFTVPENKFLSGFQYVGFINSSDKYFNWLPFDVHLICPIYLDIENVYLDYSNPNAPKILAPEDSSEITSAFDELKKDSIIQFKQSKLSLREFEGLTDENELTILGIAGKPNLLQDDDVPICPKSGKKMKFLCQFSTWNQIETEFTNVECEDKFMQQYFERMNFWCDGSLYVFIEPESKTVCYYIQNT
ncbi:hypothetical protein [Kaistella antarctica]|uniref:DUF1963 domain-containing protein n=1 Tax=Kaistella antarctica TaxID=266748 RepID=A0A3S4V2P1_9FLAO|nr:hypothetical protein [Kaistella antarctica]KEY18745.1 hypothetical protein HY04_09720 [Kaistella antarctica]SEW15933.1 hypothetical protein SAMN05421765_2789 [Kaistella antarctica]VEH99603.1 Uncharacterised protein [Kaistella antarctica]